MGTLYVVATPIGNLADLTDRARSVLNAVELVACEDTRHTGILLKRLGISKQLLSVHAFNEVSRVDPLLDALNSVDVALVSDAGTPGVSDPGAVLVRAAADAGHTVVPIPGPSSLAAAMSVSGFAEGPVLFLGFLPRKRSERELKVRLALTSGSATFIFESPHRLQALLELLAEIEPMRGIAVFRELTKLHEEILRGSASSLARVLESRESIRGEIVVGIAPAIGDKPLDESDVRRIAKSEIESGGTPSSIAKRISAATGLSRSEAYDIVRKLKAESSSN